VLSFAISPLASRMADAAPAKLTYTGKAMGTYVTVWFWTDQEATAAKAAESVFAEMKRLDAMMTTWTETSEVSRVNQAAGKKPVAVSAETFAVVERAADISKKSGGLFDVSVGAFKGLWKFDEDMDNSLPSDEDVNARLSLIGYKDIILNKAKRTVFLKRAGMLINLGGIAKGYAVDRCAAILKKAGFTDFMVQAGGDMYVAGKKGVDPWVVGIRDPRGQRDEMFALMPIENHSFSTSGDYERGFVKDGTRYHHILDPRTGHPARASRSVTIRAKDAFTADAWSKVMFIAGYKDGLAMIAKYKLKDFEVVWIDDKNELHMTPAIEKQLQLKKQPTAGP
jgi:thiamine biosynthesis lipoprotein